MAGATVSFTINVQALRDRASKRAATVATIATLLPAQGSKVAALAGVAGVTAPFAADVTQDARAGNPLMAVAQADRCHAGGWDDVEIATFTSRVVRFMRSGISATDADDLAERLTLRDRDLDDRHLCLECSHLMTSGRCAAAALGHLEGADPRMQPVPTILMRCEQFAGAMRP